MGAALLLYAGVSIFFYVVNGPPPPDGYTHDDVCIRCGEDYEWYNSFNQGEAGELNGPPQQIMIVEGNK